MNKKREMLFLWGLFVAALALRFAYDFFLKKNYLFYDFPGDDVLYYQKWAQEISRENFIGNKVFYGLPLYPYFLAVLDRLTFGNIFIIRLIHLALGSFNVVLAYLLAKRIFNQTVAVIAGVLSAVNFTLIYYDWLMMPVTLLVTLTLTILYFLAKENEIKKPREWFILGLLIGLAALGDGKFLFFSLILLFFWALTKAPKPRVLFILGGITFILAVVTARNFLVSKDLIFISGQSGMAFYIGNNPKASGVFDNPTFLHPSHEGHDEDPTVIAQAVTQKTLKPSEVSRFWFDKSLEFIRSNPRNYAALLLKKAKVFFSEDERADDIDLVLQRKWRDSLNVNSLSIMIPLALLGIIVSLRQRQIYPLVFLIVSQFIFTLIFYLLTRHRATILPLLLILEAQGLVWIYQTLRQKNFLRAGTAYIGIIAFMFLLEPFHFPQNYADSLSWAKSGVIYDKKGDYLKAKEYYLKALSIQPDDGITLFNLGNAYVQLGELPLAIEKYEHALTINPFDTDVMYNLAYAYEEAGRVEIAVQIYETVLGLEPESYDARLRLAQLYKKSGDCGKAQAHFQMTLLKFPHLKDEIEQQINSCRNKDSTYLP